MAPELAPAATALRFTRLPTTTEEVEPCLRHFLAEYLKISVDVADLGAAWALMTVPARPDVPTDLVIAERMSDSETVYLLTHAAAHAILSRSDPRHGMPGGTIVEPRRDPRTFALPPAVGADEARLHAEADALAAAIFWGECRSESETGTAADHGWRSDELALTTADGLSDLLPGQRVRWIRGALALGLSRSVILQGLRLVRGAYYVAGSPFSARAFTDCIRELLCVTELVAAAPQLTSIDKD